MRTILMVSISLLSLFEVPIHYQDSQCILVVNIINIETDHGQIILDLYNSGNSYKDEVPMQRFILSKNEVVDGKIKFQTELECGTYAIAVIDDVNKDNKINRNIIGYPLEGFGFSCYDRFPLKKPDYESICFELIENDNNMDIRLKY